MACKKLVERSRDHIYFDFLETKINSLNLVDPNTTCFFSLKMKFSKTVSSSRRKSRKRYFTAPSSVRRKLMSASLSKDLRKKHNVRSLPIRRDDEVVVTRGHYKGQQAAKVLAVSYSWQWK